MRMVHFQKKIWKPQKQNAGFSSLPELNIWGIEFQRMNMRLLHIVTTKMCFKNCTANILQKHIITQLQTMNSSSSHLEMTPVWNIVQAELSK